MQDGQRDDQGGGDGQKWDQDGTEVSRYQTEKKIELQSKLVFKSEIVLWGEVTQGPDLFRRKLDLQRTY